MRLINEVTVVIKKRSFPSFIDELYKRDCDLIELKHIEETGEGFLYTLRIASTTAKRFDEFMTIIGSAGEKYKIISVQNVIEDRVAGGLINVAGRMPVENTADFNTAVLGAADFIREKVKQEGGARYTGIGRNVGILCGIKAADEAERGHLLQEFTGAERDAVILHRFTGLNGYPLTVRFDHPEDLIKVVKRIEGNFSAVRVIRIDEATIMLYDLLFSEIAIPVISMEHDDIPLLLLIFIIKLMMKYRFKAEETTVGFVGIDLSAVRLTRVLDKIGFRRVLGFDQAEKALLALENHGGLATTAENIFSNADLTILMKNNFDRDEYLKIRPGQLVISFLDDEDQEMDALSGTGVREFISGGAHHLAALFPGIMRGVMDAGAHTIPDAKMVDYAKKLVGLMSDTFEFPNLFGDVHEKVRAIIAADAAKPATPDGRMP